MSAFAALPQSATYVSQGFFLFKLYFVSGPFMDNAVTNLLLSRVILLFLNSWRQDQVNVGGEHEKGTSLY